MDSSLEELVTKAGQGDAEAIEELYKIYETRMVSLVHFRLGNTLHGLMDSVDLVQSVWKDILTGLDRFEYKGSESFYSWLKTCLVNKIQNKRRFHHAQKRDSHKSIALEDPNNVIVRNDPSPSQMVINNEELSVLIQALKKIPHPQSQILLLRMRDELSFEEIAESLGKSRESVKKSYNRYLKKLVDLLPREWRGGA